MSKLCCNLWDGSADGGASVCELKYPFADTAKDTCLCLIKGSASKNRARLFVGQSRR